MRARKLGKGGKHVAIERGLRPTGSGWPFRRELLELALMCRSVGQPTLPAIAIQKEQKPCEA
jgi:hypothetical protein